MGIITEEVLLNVNVKNIKYYESMGYVIPKRKVNGKMTAARNTQILVRVNDLCDMSSAKIDVQCDCCGKTIYQISYSSFNINSKEGKYYCKQCASSLYGLDNSLKTRLHNSKSFEQWCVENNRYDILNRWDYTLNKCKPSDVFYSSTKNYYFICENGIHDSEARNISSFTHRENGKISCSLCNSFAYYLISLYGEDALDVYWDYSLNVDDPWKISKNSCRTVWIKCDKTNYHGSYDITCNSFTSNKRCPFCSRKRIHKLDSVGTLYPDVFKVWSEENKKSPYEYLPHSSKNAWWKCPEGLHDDYMRSIDISKSCNFRCPKCNVSKGELNIANFLNKNNILYQRQKMFDNLIGLGNGSLSYDFYLPDYNLLIEYQGQFHDGKGNEYMKQNLKKQQEHDRRKRKYAKDHDISLLEIWYWDFDNIDEILNRELVLKN